MKSSSTSSVMLTALAKYVEQVPLSVSESQWKKAWRATWMKTSWSSQHRYPTQMTDLEKESVSWCQKCNHTINECCRNNWQHAEGLLTLSTDKINKGFCWFYGICWPQEQVEQNMREKAEMQKELDRLMEEKRVMKEEQQEILSLKVWLVQHLRHNGRVWKKTNTKSVLTKVISLSTGAE